MAPSSAPGCRRPWATSTPSCTSRTARCSTPRPRRETRVEREEYLRKRYGFIDKQLAGKQFLFGDQFTVADAYLYTVTTWAAYVKFDLSAFPNLVAFQARVAARPAVQQTLKAEGLAG